VGGKRIGEMLFEHWIYSAAIAVVSGMLYHKFTGRDCSWIIIASAYAPDIDTIVSPLLEKLGITLLIYGSPIKHGDFHNIAVLLAYAVFIALLLHPVGIRVADSFFFASIGFGAHLFEDALVFDPGYAFLWPLSMKNSGIGIFNYTPDWYGIADKEVLIIGIIAVVLSLVLRTAYEGKEWNIMDVSG